LGISRLESFLSRPFFKMPSFRVDVLFSFTSLLCFLGVPLDEVGEVCHFVVPIRLRTITSSFQFHCICFPAIAFIFLPSKRCDGRTQTVRGASSSRDFGLSFRKSDFLSGLYFLRAQCANPRHPPSTVLFLLSPTTLAV